MLEIYYVEDDAAIARIVQAYLEEKNCHVRIFPTLTAVREAFETQLPEMVLVDWNMPDGQGDQFCRWIRQRWKELPILFLTVRGDPRDIVSGFQNGADDYVVKPFSLEVLYSRMCALLRRMGKEAQPYLTCGRIRMDQNRMQVLCGEEEIALSQMEYELLKVLLQNKGKTLTRGRLLEQIWDSNGSFVNDNTLTVTMKRLREKLHQPACLKTIRSFGYRMEDVL